MKKLPYEIGFEDALANRMPRKAQFHGRHQQNYMRGYAEGQSARKALKRLKRAPR